MSPEREEYADWRGKNADPREHGGVRAASFVCVVEVLENLVFLSNASNFVVYFLMSMNYKPAEASNMVTNFMGTSFLLTIFGGFISDSFITRFKTFIFFCSIELLGLILLTVQAHEPHLHPAMGRRPSGSQAAILYAGLYAMAFGVGGVKATLPAHGADQLDHSNQRLISAFFNWFFFSLCTGGLISVTLMIWIEENLGWNWSFKISVIVLSVTLFIFTIGFSFYRYKLPGGSPLSRIFKVFASTARNWKLSPIERVNGRSHSKFKILDKALIDNTVTATDVEETKTFLGLLPIFATTILMNCCLAQLMTFTVQQGNIMNRTIHHFKIPTQSLTVFPLIIMLASIPLYEQFVRIFGNEKAKMFQPLRRIGLGLALASGSMAVAAIVEVKRREAAENNVILSVFWLGWQYLLLGVSDMLTLGGMLEFFYSEAPASMRSMSTALSWCSTSMGYFLSSVLVGITNSVSGKYGQPWLGGKSLNQTRLDLFYTLLSILNILNLLAYMYCAKRY
ncbi:protein NRT1/ PTR FAMILY 4.2 isoform X1 [Quercus robur]|uniref:protein NRT1/ PTR FAMILY 4.2 isoform X1 n=2 Tax=Quercus robur TaxID=38942 RepID=UPI0021627FA8|nr:protein NRT1/ PTR FAMILY 4.2 isoform X1 [Quercus robur]